MTRGGGREQTVEVEQKQVKVLRTSIAAAEGEKEITIVVSLEKTEDSPEVISIKCRECDFNGRTQTE